jgi:hypothetical protein
MGDALSRQRQPLSSTTATRNRTTRSVSSGFTRGTPKQVALPYCRRASTLRRKPIAYGRRPQRTEIWGCCGSHAEAHATQTCGAMRPMDSVLRQVCAAWLPLGRTHTLACSSTHRTHPQRNYSARACTWGHTHTYTPTSARAHARRAHTLGTNKQTTSRPQYSAVPASRS